MKFKANSSCSHLAVTRLSSVSHRAVISQSSGSHQAVFRQSSGSLQAVIKQWAFRHKINMNLVIYFAAYKTESLFSLVNWGWETIGVFFASISWSHRKIWSKINIDTEYYLNRQRNFWSRCNYLPTYAKPCCASFEIERLREYENNYSALKAFFKYYNDFNNYHRSSYILNHRSSSPFPFVNFQTTVIEEITIWKMSIFMVRKFM